MAARLAQQRQAQAVRRRLRALAALAHEHRDARGRQDRQGPGHQQRRAEAGQAVLRARQEAAERRPGDEPQGEGRPEQADPPGAEAGRGDVGDVALDGRQIAGGQAGQETHGQRDPQVGREGQADEAQARAEDGAEQDRPPADAVGQTPPDRLGEEVADREGGEHPGHLPGGGVEGLGVERQDRHEDAEADQVHEHHQQQHQHGGPAGGGRLGVHPRRHPRAWPEDPAAKTPTLRFMRRLLGWSGWVPGSAYAASPLRWPGMTSFIEGPGS